MPPFNSDMIVRGDDIPSKIPQSGGRRSAEIAALEGAEQGHFCLCVQRDILSVVPIKQGPDSTRNPKFLMFPRPTPFLKIDDRRNLQSKRGGGGNRTRE
jgi:hypothetical protein